MSKVLGFTINIQGTDKAIETSEQLKRAISDLQKELKKTEDVEAIKKLEAELVDLKARQAQVNAEVRESVKIRQRELNAVDEVSGTYDQLSRTLNEQRKRYKDLAAAGKDFTAEALQLRGEINQLDKQLKKIDADVGQFQRNVGDYAGQLQQFFPRVAGTIGDVTNGFKAAQGAATGFNRALGLIGAVVTIFSVISEAISSANEFSKEFVQIQTRLAQTTELSNAQIEKQSAAVIAISRTYQQESNEILTAATALSKEFDISFERSFELIEAGFRKGANAQGDFLSQLREYPAQFAAAGGSAEDFVAILIQAQNEGIYSDKGIDAIKEFGLRIREQTTSTREALTNAFGAQFTNELFNNLNSGAITTVDALRKVGKGLQDTGLTAEQTQRVIADAFGGAGEDAGLRYLQLLGNIAEATDEVTASTNKYEEQQSALYRSNLLLAAAQAELSVSVKQSSSDLTILWNGIKAVGLGVVSDLIDQFRGFKVLLTSTLDGVATFFRSTGGIQFRIEDALAAIQQSALDQQAQYIEEQKKKQEEEKKQRGDFNQDILNTEAELNKRLEALRIQRANTQIGSAQFKELTKEIEQIEKRLADANKKAGTKGGEALVEGSIAAIQKKANELKTAIEKAVAGSEAQKALIDQYNKQVQILEDAIANRNRIELQAEREAFLARVTTTETLTTSLAIPAAVKSEKDQGEAQRKELTKQFEKLKIELKKNRQELSEEEAAEALRRRQDIINYTQQGVQATFGLINTLTAAANQRRNEIFQQQIESTEANITELEERAGKATGIRKRLLEQQVAQEKKLLAEQTKLQEEEQKKQRKAAKRNAIIQSIIEGSLAVVRSLNTPPVPNFPLAIASGVFAAIQTATIAAQPLATGGVVGISGRRVTDRANMPTRSNGDNVLATVKRGEVVLNERQQAALGGAATFRSIGVPGFATGGMVSPPLPAPSLPRTISDAGNVIAALDRKTDAISARIDRLRAFVITEDIQREFDDAESIKVKAEL